MNFDATADCLAGVLSAMSQLGFPSGGIVHDIEQLRIMFEAKSLELAAGIEKNFQETIKVGTRSVEVSRNVDVVIEGIIDGVQSLLHTEIKTGNAASAIKSVLTDLDTLEQDAALAVKRAAEAAAAQAQEDFKNYYIFTNKQFDALGTQTIQDGMTKLKDRLVAGFKDDITAAELKTAIGSFRFVDQFGTALQASLNANGDVILQPAMDVVFGPGGLLAKAALDGATHSPDFSPAMQALFGASGKIADAAKDAATAANLDPALEPFEQKVEDGVKAALDQAGDDVKSHAASSLASQVGEGATALGNIFTSIPQMADSVKQLGEVWNQPLDSVDSYMKLFGALGGTITQGVQTIEALAGVTKIASAAQAIFNAVMAMNPVVLIVIAVVALIAAIALLIVYWDQVKAALRDNPWLAVVAVMFGLIGIIIVIIAYWDEIKLAVLIAANFISIQLQKIGAFFVGLGTLIGMVWDYITASAANVGISIINFFITAGTEVQNFFIGLINFVLEAYNAIADSVIGDILGLEKAELIPEVQVESRLIPPKEVPTIDVEAAFKPAGKITGGLEGAIAEQRGVVAAGQQADADRRAQEAAAQQPPAPPALPPGAPTAGPGGLPPRPALPEGAGAGAPGGGGGGVRVEGGIVININAERMELDAAEVLTEEIVSQLKTKLDAMQTAADFRTGVRTA